MNIYIIGSIVVCILINNVSSSLLLNKNEFFNGYVLPLVDDTFFFIDENEGLSNGTHRKNWWDFVYSFTNCTFLMAYMIIASLSIGLSTNMTLMKDRSPNNVMIKDFLEKHMLYIRVFTIIWTTYLASSFITLQFAY